MFINSENTSCHINACDSSLIVTVMKDTAESRSACFQLSGVCFLPITAQSLQASSDQAYHLRLPLKEVTQVDCVEKRASANDCLTDIEMLQAEPFYYRCRKCGAVILSRHLWVLGQVCSRFMIQIFIPHFPGADPGGFVGCVWTPSETKKFFWSNCCREGAEFGVFLGF